MKVTYTPESSEDCTFGNCTYDSIKAPQLQVNAEKWETYRSDDESGINSREKPSRDGHFRGRKSRSSKKFDDSEVKGKVTEAKEKMVVVQSELDALKKNNGL